MSDIFICYSSEDRETALRLRDVFHDQGWDCFIDTHIHAGKRFDLVIEQALEVAKAVVVLWSKASCLSRYVRDEAEDGISREILVPVLIENVRIPLGFRATQAANLCGWTGSMEHSGLQDQLLPSLRSLLGGAAEQAANKATATPKAATPAAFSSAGSTFRDTLKDGTPGPEMVTIPPGRFLMGSPKGEKGRSKDEGPQHDVVIGDAFGIGRYPVMFCDFDLFAQSSDQKLPSDKGWGRDNRPAINVSWEDAVAYCQWLTEQTGRTYRLPSEAEWEYAARGGTTTRFWWGDQKGEGRANFRDSGSEWSGAQTSPTDSFDANPFGLHDVHGNVWEWCQDGWHSDYEGAPTDGSAWTSGEGGARVLRGGSWNFNPGLARAAARINGYPGRRNDLVGIRVCSSSSIK